MWLNAFDARARLQKERDINATPGTSGPPAVAAVTKNYQMTCFFMSQCSLETLIKLKSFVALRNIVDIREHRPRDLLRAESISQFHVQLHMRRNVAPIVKNLSRHHKPKQCGRCEQKLFHPIQIMSAQLRVKSFTKQGQNVRCKETTPECAS